MSAGQDATSARRLSRPFVAATLAVAFTLGMLAGFGLPRVLGSASRASAVAPPGLIGARGVHTPDVAENDVSDAAYAALYGPEVRTRGVAGDGLAAIRAGEKTPLTAIQLAPVVEGALRDVRAAERAMASAGAARPGSSVHTPDVAANNMSDAAYAALYGSR